MIGHEEKTIISQCTPKGNGALALIRISGPQAISIADQIAKLASKQNLFDVATHTIHFGWIMENEEIIDQVMFIVMHGPKTFTGEDVIEITCHNNQFIIEKILTLAISKKARLAQPGEFAKRAFLNGKLDLLQAEAINEIINAQTQQAIKKNLSQIEGSFSNWISKIEEKLIRCLALSESSFEFIDDEIEFGPEINGEIENITQQIKKIKQTFNLQQQIKEGIRIALIGSVNAGKSSLFNSLLGKNRSIVTNVAGTTRDSIEAGMYQENYFMTLIDTAGLRNTNDFIEKEGIERSLQEIEKSDIVLLLFDGSRILTNEELSIHLDIINKHKSKIICIINKIDLEQKITINETIFNNIETIEISTKNNVNITILEQKIKEKISVLLSRGDAPFLLNKRQFNLLLDLENKLKEIQKKLSVKSIEYEILSIHINEALQSISELTGKSISEKGMDKVFKEFCVGK